MKYMEYVVLFCSSLAALMLVYLWYHDVQIPAWQALLWCSIVVLEDFAKVLRK